MTALHIGIDIDNTIIDYDQVFGPVGEEMALLPPGHGLRGKAAVKAFLTKTPNGEEGWMQLQGQVYGRCIGRAVMYDGVAEFMCMARDAGARVSLVSHKTRYGHFDANHVNLWQAALSWLETHKFFSADGFGLMRKDVHFRETRDAKIETIATIGCDLFVDDLPEILEHKSFPPFVRRIWFAGSGTQTGDLPLYHDWSQITAVVEPLLTGEGF